jgi:hypothetical protein
VYFDNHVDYEWGVEYLSPSPNKNVQLKKKKKEKKKPSWKT